MTTCIGARAARGTVTGLSPDDFGGAISIEEDGSWVAVTGNAGFENGEYNWAEVQSRWVCWPRVQVGEGDGRHRHAYLMDADTGVPGSIVSRVRVYDGRGGLDGHMANVSFHARINARDVVPNGLGKVTFLLRARAVVYEDAGRCSDPDDNLNDVDFVKNEWLNIYGFMFPQSSWTFVTRGEGQGTHVILDPGTQYGVSDRPDALEMDLIISNRVKQDFPSGIVPAPVRIDRSRIRVDF